MLLRTILLMWALLMSLPVLAAPVAVTDSGRVAGSRDGAVDAYLGIPFAAPPVGANRWRAPQPAARWTGTRDATRFGHSCWQSVSPQGFGPWSHEYVVQGDISEDCLFLNVWTPGKAKRLPVLVWIHGGGFKSGSGAIPIYAGRSLAADGVVVVTVNYRVGPFGFLAHPELTAEANGAPPANFGLQDMVAALRWVRANIAAFGGDPAQVTIAGQSAGAGAVHDLIASPMARGLFARAIAQSGLPRPGATRTLAAAEQDGLALMREVSAGSLAELRALPPERIVPARGGNAVRFTPVIDGVVLAQAPEQARADGAAARVAMLAGFTADEASAQTGYGSDDPAALATAIDETFGARATQATRLYPSASADERARSNRQVRRDRWAAMLRDWAAAKPAGGAPKLFAYRWDHPQPGPGADRWRAFHSSEIPYVFRTLDAAPQRSFTAIDRALSEAASRYWINFVKTGDPNGSGLPRWREFDPAAPQLLVFDTMPAMQPLLDPAKLAAFTVTP
jgi:para-nitrobenzyl esterase